MKKKYKCLSCCKEINKPKSFGGVDGHCRPGDLVYNNNDLFSAIENVNNISIEQVHCDNNSEEFISIIGCEYYVPLYPFEKIKKRIGSTIRYGRYKAIVIDNKWGPCHNHKIKIIRDLTNFEKLLLILKKDYKYILSRFTIKDIGLLRKMYPKSIVGAYKFVIESEIRSIKWEIKNGQFAHEYDKI